MYLCDHPSGSSFNVNPSVSAAGRLQICLTWWLAGSATDCGDLAVIFHAGLQNRDPILAQILYNFCQLWETSWCSLKLDTGKKDTSYSVFQAHIGPRCFKHLFLPSVGGSRVWSYTASVYMLCYNIPNDKCFSLSHFEASAELYRLFNVVKILYFLVTFCWSTVSKYPSCETSDSKDKGQRNWLHVPLDLTEGSKLSPIILLPAGQMLMLYILKITPNAACHVLSVYILMDCRWADLKWASVFSL